jgi:hypothetical protein
MRHLECPRCGLSIEQRTVRAAFENCPRCLGRDGVEIPLFASGTHVRLIDPQTETATPDRPSPSAT